MVWTQLACGWTQGTCVQDLLKEQECVRPPSKASLLHQVKAAAYHCGSHFQPLQRTEALSNCWGVLQLEFVTWYLVPSIYAGAYGIWEGTSGGCAVWCILAARSPCSFFFLLWDASSRISVLWHKHTVEMALFLEMNSKMLSLLLYFLPFFPAPFTDSQYCDTAGSARGLQHRPFAEEPWQEPLHGHAALGPEPALPHLCGWRIQ